MRAFAIQDPEIHSVRDIKANLMKTYGRLLLRDRGSSNPIAAQRRTKASPGLRSFSQFH